MINHNQSKIFKLLVKDIRLKPMTKKYFKNYLFLPSTGYDEIHFWSIVTRG